MLVGQDGVYRSPPIYCPPTECQGPPDYVSEAIRFYSEQKPRTPRVMSYAELSRQAQSLDLAPPPVYTTPASAPAYAMDTDPGKPSKPKKQKRLPPQYEPKY